MLCPECGGDGWKTVANSHQVVTLQCQVCDGTGISHPESPESPTQKAQEAFWAVIQTAMDGDGHDFNSIGDRGV